MKVEIDPNAKSEGIFMDKHTFGWQQYSYRSLSKYRVSVVFWGHYFLQRIGKISRYSIRQSFSHENVLLLMGP